ncbi:hypothetical protein DDE18_16115 [Nocardioides gansuensis]|uniref:Uncharacterized protein n=1 Tax=Nocardioides gansuensis TaxID=2138300 RepID=A0A2T8F749_9ACTN|nr:hypothetical protein [Nocardioides gansuensis]PVG81536.1 hypothetical protein DDE18_16115 [Nocardioides gansuensis]
MGSEFSTDDVVYESALQLWAAAQTDFDPYQVPPSEWAPAVPISDADIATDTQLDLDVVQDSLRRLDGKRLVIGEAAGTMSVEAPISEGGPP